MSVIEIVYKWYDDGFATWSYRGAGDGEDGIFGGSFHSINDIAQKDGAFLTVVDFGSADKEKALEELSRRLEAVGFTVREQNGVIIIEKI